MNLSRLKIGTRLIFCFGILVFIMLVASTVSYFEMQRIGTLIEDQNKLRQNKLERLYVVREALAQTGLAARNAYIFEDHAHANAELDILDKQKAVYLDALKEMTPYFKGDAQFEKVNSGLLTMAKELNKPRQFRKDYKMQEFGHFLVDECSPLCRKIVTDIDLLLTSTQKIVEDESRLATEMVDEGQKLNLIVSLLAVFISIFIGIVLTRSLLRQLGGEPNDVSRIASMIAKGDLTVHVPARGNDKTSIMHAMQEMRDNLAMIVSQVRTGTETIVSASSQIAAGNLDLSSRTEQQASSLEETASSMEELTTTVKQNADNARRANVLATNASEVANKGGAVVSEVVTTMSGINEASRKIADIISVIDGIAFQTNILALNAAVEAARAGEQGRGFAVVATEVRNLAQRSASAAKEIKTLINDSVNQVEAGGRLVSQAGDTMQEIVTSVKQVTDIMGDIATASAEQTSGIEQINQAIVQMDQVTQQNSALVEEAAAATSSMQDHAKNLSGVVSVFKVDAGKPEAVQPAAFAKRVHATVSKAVAVPVTAPTPPAARAMTPVAAPRKEPRLNSNHNTNDGDWSEF